MADQVDTMTSNIMARISIEPTFTGSWPATAGGTRPAFPAMMARISSVDGRSSAVAREKGVENQ